METQLLRVRKASGYSQLNVMGLVATKATYEHGDEWHQSSGWIVAQYLEQQGKDFRGLMLHAQEKIDRCIE